MTPLHLLFYNLSDDELEYQIQDRYSFCRFLDPEDRVPDVKTIWLFREILTQHKTIKVLFDKFDGLLRAKGYQAQKGQIVDASIDDVPKQWNSREENAQIKQGETAARFEQNDNFKRQKDIDARWTKENGQSRFGYNDHISIDNKHKLIRDYAVTSAEVHDSQVFFDVLAANSAKAVWADSAYQSEDNEMTLYAMDYRSHVHEKGQRNKPLNKRQQQANHKRSKIRIRVEHVFGSITNEQSGLFYRVIGLERIAAKIGLTNLVYNMRRLVVLNRMSVPAI